MSRMKIAPLKARHFGDSGTTSSRYKKPPRVALITLQLQKSELQAFINYITNCFDCCINRFFNH